MNNKKGIQAIETIYGGYRFRSRLEARWAVFFDVGKIRWQYEIEGFELEDGTRYLPDFYLPDFDAYVEVKPDTEEGRKEIVEKCSRFITWGGPIKQLLILSNIPDEIKDPGIWHFPVFYWRDTSLRLGWWFFQDLENEKGKKYLAGHVSRSSENYKSLTWWNHEIPDSIAAISDRDSKLNYHIRPDRPFHKESYEAMQAQNSLFFDALREARKARFEHGEMPIAPNDMEDS